jgi:TonB family protein
VDTLSGLVATFIMNAFWQTAMVTGLALGVDRVLCRAPARFRHTLWALALAAAVALPVASLRPSVARRGTVTYAVGAAVPVSERASDRISGNLWQTARSWLHHARQEGIPLPRPWARGLLGFYAALLGVGLVRLGRAWHRARQIGRRASPARISIVAIAEQCRDALAAPSRPLAHPIRILTSAEIPGPIALGVRRAAIVLPTALLEADGGAELRAALSHELAHVQRRDYLWNLVHEVMLLPISFHPLALLIRQRLARTRELACDEMAAVLLGRSQYARSLVRVAHQVSRFSTARQSELTLGIFDIDILEERVMKLLDPKPLSSTRLAKMTLLAGAAILAICCLAAPKLSIAAASVGGQTADAPNKIITGVVVDSSGSRIHNAQLWLKGRRGSVPFVKATMTDAAGNFAFADVVPGRYTLQADSPGKTASYSTITVKPGGQSPFLAFVLKPEDEASGSGQPSMPGTSPKKIRVNGAREEAKLIYSPPPKYPASAKARGIQGLVRIDATISAAGVPAKLRIVSSPDKLLSKAALDGVRQWRYKPTLLNGKPVAVETLIDVNFTLRR